MNDCSIERMWCLVLEHVRAALSLDRLESITASLAAASWAGPGLAAAAAASLPKNLWLCYRKALF